MDRCQVVGTLWATRKVEKLNGYKLVILSVLDIEQTLTNTLIVAVDTLDTSLGQHVLVTYGSGARNILKAQNLPIEAAIAGIIDDG